MASIEFKTGYEIARAEIEKANPERNWAETGKAVNNTMKMFTTVREAFNGVFEAVSDYANGREWQF